MTNDLENIGKQEYYCSVLDISKIDLRMVEKFVENCMTNEDRIKFIEEHGENQEDYEPCKNLKVVYIKGRSEQETIELTEIALALMALKKL